MEQLRKTLPGMSRKSHLEGGRGVSAAGGAAANLTRCRNPPLPPSRGQG